MTTDTFATLKLAALATSPTNPRKTFDTVKLTELAESIKTSGVHQPILVRPLPGHRISDTPRATTHEVVCGERRYRASQMAGALTIPALVRDLTDAQVMEIQLVENLQRDDLTELEEAEGYQALIEASALSADAIASKIGKSRSYVFGRLKLLDLSVECKQALREGQIDASRAILIARIPDTALQTKALAEATRKAYDGQVCSVRALQGWLQANVMLRLERAAFSPSDSMLVVGAGACSSCPKRTGANPDLFADVAGADICIDPTCFHEKEDAHRNSVLDTAAKRGMRLIEGEEAGEICSQYTGHLDGYTALSQARADTADGQEATLGQLLGKDLAGAVLIENPWTKELIAAVPTAEAEAMLLARGLVKAVQQKAKPAADIEGDIKRLQDKAQKEITKRFRNDAFTALAENVHSSTPLNFQAMPGLLRAWWLVQVDELHNRDLAKLFNLTLQEPKGKTAGEVQDAQTTQVRLHVQACDSGKLYKALVLFLVLEDNPEYFYGDMAEPTLFEALASELDVDLDEIEVNAAHSVRDTYADDLKKLKAQLKGTDTAAIGYRGPNGETWSGRGLMPRWLTVLVQAGQDKEAFKIQPATPPKSSTTGTPAAQAKGAGGRKPKTTAAEAQAQIAAAMQAQDTNPGADAQGVDADSSQPADIPVACAPVLSQPVGADVDFGVGQRVRVTTDGNKLGRIASKWSGKEGTITRREQGGGYWDVTFRGRGGGVAMFAEDQITFVSHPVMPA